MNRAVVIYAYDGRWAWELQAAALLKAVGWDFRLADGLVLFLCTVTDFLAKEKARGVEFCMRVGLSEQVFSLFGELWIGSRGVTGRRHKELGLVGPVVSQRMFLLGHLRRRSVGIGNWGRRRCLRPYGGICVLQAC